MGRQKPKLTSGNVEETIGKMKSLELIDFLKGHNLLKGCSPTNRNELPGMGELVWARNYGSVYWPAFIADVKDREDVEKVEGEHIDDSTYTFVMFLEDAFRIAPVPWEFVIPIREDEIQQMLLLRYNRVIVKKSWKQTTVYKKSLLLLEKFKSILPSERLKAAERCYSEIATAKQPKKVSSESLKPKRKEEPSDVIKQKLLSEANDRRKSGRRVSERIVHKEVSKKEEESHAKTTAKKKTEQESEDKAVKLIKVNKNGRPEVGGEKLKQWTKDRFETLEKQFLFEASKPLRCHLCTEGFENDKEVKMCHGLPHHERCLTQIKQDGGDTVTFKCNMCLKQQCFICKLTTDEKNCTAMKCSRCDLRFHIDCLCNWPQAEIQGPNGPITCPLHFCHTCLGEQRAYNKVRDYTLSPSKAYRCFLCLSTYHKVCIPAGCGEDIMKKDYIICPKHNLPALKVQQRRIGCLTCCKPLKPKQERVECSFCIQLFHPECVGYTQDLQSSGITLDVFGADYKCVSCTWGLFPVYGQVVWFQQSLSQYWPARILYPKEFKQREFAKRLTGQFSIEYFGTTSYYDNASRVMPLHLTTVEIFKTMKVYQYTAKIQRAHEEAAFCLTFAEEYRDSLLPPPKPVYRKIEKNIYRHVNGNKTKEPNDVCSCAETDKTSPLVCEADSGCTNRDMEMECSDKTCKGGSRCSNRMFKERKVDEEFIQQKLFPKKGWGVIAQKEFKPGDFVAEYRGEVIDREEMIWRLNRKVEEDPLYILDIQQGFYIDAEFVGNVSRLINHSCDPNCEVRKYLSLGKPVGGIFALRDIGVGEEVTFTYGYGNESTAPFRCRCGASNCAIFVGKSIPPGFQAEEDAEQYTDKWDDVCLKCGFGGSVICCEYPGCGKVCHYQCVGLSRAPRSHWCCPDHPTKAIQKRSSKSLKSRRTKSSLRKSTTLNSSKSSKSHTPSEPKKQAAEADLTSGSNPATPLSDKSKIDVNSLPRNGRSDKSSDDLLKKKKPKQLNTPKQICSNQVPSSSPMKPGASSDTRSRKRKHSDARNSDSLTTPSAKRLRRSSEPRSITSKTSVVMNGARVPRGRRFASETPPENTSVATRSKRVRSYKEIENERNSPIVSDVREDIRAIFPMAPNSEVSVAVSESMPPSGPKSRKQRKSKGTEPFSPLALNSFVTATSVTTPVVQEDKSAEILERPTTRSSESFHSNVLSQNSTSATMDTDNRKTSMEETKLISFDDIKKEPQDSLEYARLEQRVASFQQCGIMEAGVSITFEEEEYDDELDCTFEKLRIMPYMVK